MVGNSQEQFAFLWSTAIFAVSIGLIGIFLFVEYLVSRGKEGQDLVFFENKITRNSTTNNVTDEKALPSSQTVNVEGDQDSGTPSYGPFRRASQKLEQFFLDYPSLYALGIIFISCLKYFVQIFDIFTDASIAATFLDGDFQRLPQFVISIALMTAPWATKWMTFTNFLTEKNKQKQLPIWVSYLNFFFPVGVFLPLIADMYILSRVLKGHASALWTGEKFQLQDDYFSLQRTFALLEAQTESLPQALFQCGILFSVPWNGDQAWLIFLSVSVSLVSMLLQFLTLRALAEKESYSSVFGLIGALAKGEFLAGLNQIKNSTSSILNLSSVFIDSEKMNLVSEMIGNRENLHTVILNSNVLSYPFDFIGSWLCRLNALNLKFLHARKVDDIQDAFRDLDKDGDETISTEELSNICGSRMIAQWDYKYGPKYKMNIQAILGFIRSEPVAVPGTSFTIFEVASDERFPENLRRSAERIVEALGQSVGVDHPLRILKPSDDFYDDVKWYKNLVALNGSLVKGFNATLSPRPSPIDTSMIHYLHLPNLVVMNLKETNVKRVDKIFHGNLPKLETLTLQGCTAIIDSEIKARCMIGLPNLKELDISKSRWENCGELFAAEFPSLKKLNMDSCKSLKTDDVDKIGFVALEELSLSESNWENSEALFGSELPSLKKLNIEGCRSLKTENLTKVGLVGLEELALWYKPFEHLGILFVSQRRSLKKLSISVCFSLKMEDLDNFELLSLEELNFSHSEDVSNYSLLFASNLPSLKKLSMYQCNLAGDEEVDSIGLVGLKELHLNVTSMDCAALFAAELPFLKKLNMQGCIYLKSENVDKVRLFALEELNLTETDWKNCAALFAAELPSLKKLQMNGCQSLKSEDVIKVRLFALEELDLSNTNWENCAVIFAAELPSLKKLKMSGCKSLKSEDVDKVRLVALEELSLAHSNWENCAVVFAELPSLKKLDMYGCNSLKSENVNKFGLVALEKLILTASNWENCGPLFAAEFPSLKTLYMDHCTSLKTEDVNEIGLVILEELFLHESNWEHVGPLFAAEFPSLKTLKMDKCKSLKTEDVNEIGLVVLEELFLQESNWEHVGPLFAAEFPSLKRLDMSYCKSLKIENLNKDGLVGLEELDLKCAHLENVASLFAATLPSLRKLDISWCEPEFLNTKGIDEIGLVSLEELIGRYGDRESNLNQLEPLFAATGHHTSLKFLDCGAYGSEDSW